MVHKLTCLLIDDDVDDQEIFSLALAQIDQSIECEFANNGMEALEKLNHNKSFIPRFIFLDLNMPGLSGKQCLAEIRKLSHLDHVPVIIYSTSSLAKDISETKKLGASDYIIKQHSMSMLIKILAEVFEKHKTSFSYL